MHAPDQPLGVKAALTGPGTFLGTREPGDTWSNLFHHPVQFAESLPSELHDLATKPVVNLEALQPPSTAKQHPFYSAVARTASGFATPENIGIGEVLGPIYKAAGAGDVAAQAVSRWASGVFSVLMGLGSGQEAIQFADAYRNGDKPGMLRAAGEFAVTAPFAAAAGAHAAKGTPPAAEPAPGLPAAQERPGLPAREQRAPGRPMPKQTPTVIPPSGEIIAAPGQPQPALGAAPARPGLPPGPRTPREELGEGLQSNIGPGEKPIPLPERNPTRIPPGEKPIPVGPSTVDPRELTKSNGKPPRTSGGNNMPPKAAAEPTLQDKKVQLAELNARYRKLDEQLSRTKSYEVTKQITAKMRPLSDQRNALRAEIEKVEPRPEAKPLTPLEKIGPRIGGEGMTHAQPRGTVPPRDVQPERAASKTPTYDKLPQEMKDAVDAIQKEHDHLPQSLREGQEADLRKLSEPGTPRKEQFAKLVANESGAKLGSVPEARPLTDRRTPIGERRLGEEPVPEGQERRAAGRRVSDTGPSIARMGLAANLREIIADPEATERDKRIATEQLGDLQANRFERAEESTDVGKVRAAQQSVRSGKGNGKPEPPAGMTWVGEGGEPSRTPTREATASREPGVLPGMEQAAREHRTAIEQRRGEELGREFAQPLSSIERNAGEMETKSPLFRGSEASPQKEIFGRAEPTSGRRFVPKNYADKSMGDLRRMLKNAKTTEEASSITTELRARRASNDAAAEAPIGMRLATAEELVGEKAAEQKGITLSEARPSDNETMRSMGVEQHDILRDGKKVGEIHVAKTGPEGKTLNVTWMGEPLGEEGGKPEDLKALSNKLGPSGIREVTRELKRLHPEATELSYTREGGAAGRTAKAKGEVSARTMLLGKGSRMTMGVDPTMVADLYRKLNNAYQEHVADPAIEKLGLGRTHKDVEAVDPKLASRIRRYEAAPQYFRTKAEDIARDITKGLSRKQERLFTLMADQQSRENLRENHPAEYAEALRDKNVQAALARYKPHAESLTKARTILGGSVMPGDHLPWVYPENVSGLGQRVAETDTGGGGFDRGITPQRTDQFGRKTTAEYHYKNGLHEFGPAFVRKYARTMTKIAEHATALDFLSKSTKIEPGDRLPPAITYNGKTFYSPEILQMIREAKPGKASDALAESLGVKTLPKPKNAEAYAQYRPTTAKDAPVYLGPRPVVQALRGLADADPGRMGPVGRFLQSQIIGMGLGVRHGFNLFRRIAQTFPLGSSSPVNWIRAARVMTDFGLKQRALSRTNDPAYDALLRWGAISPEGAGGFKEYQGRNLNPANWLRVFAKVGNRWLFEPGGVDQRARLWMRDLLKSQHPEISDERAAQLIRDQLGNYSRENWTKNQKLLSHLLLFPGWDFSSINWVIRHPIRTTVPPAILTMLVNQAIHHRGGKQEPGDQWDPFAVHAGGHAYGTAGLEEPLARAALKPFGRTVQASREGETTRQAVGEGARAIPQALAGVAGMTRPDFALPFEVAANKTRFGRDIVPQGDFTRRGAVLPNRGAEDIASHALEAFFPPVERMTGENQTLGDAMLSNFGLNRYEEPARTAPPSERQQDVRNVQDDIRALDHQARAIAEDGSLSPEEKQKRLLPLRKRYQKLVAGDRPN